MQNRATETWQRWKPAARIAGPPLLAFAILKSESLLTLLVRLRPGILPVALVALLVGLLFARVRRWLVVTLCYGIALLALRDSTRGVPLPAELDYLIVEWVYPFIWLGLALVAAIAGLAESLHPGSVWARRCYFAAAFIYFAGHGLFGFLRTHNWESMVMLLTGVVALGGVIYAHRIVAAESEEQAAEEEEDLVAQRERMEQRAAAVAAHEWRDNGRASDTPETCG